MNFQGLLRGELWLTIDILIGLLLGDLILRFKLADKLMHRLMPFLKRHGLGSIMGLALTLSLGSSKAGAALLSSALEEHKINENTALWGVLMLPFPGYLRRWPATCILAFSMAGYSGLIFALFLFARSAARFIIAFLILRRVNKDTQDAAADLNSTAQGDKSRSSSFKLNYWRKLLKTLPLAWLFFAVAYALVPALNKAFQDLFMNLKFFNFMPIAGWTVAASSIAHVSAALSMAGGSLTAGDLTAAQAVFALILGSGLGIATRVLRQNAGYYFGLFNAKLARKMLFWNLMTVLPLVFLCVIIAALPLIF
ncbi:MAG: hypothetical protein IJ667_12845 [Synergistaceae bacterium]|nr:hypothetical protein [Synergistaceae bacterium]